MADSTRGRGKPIAPPRGKGRRSQAERDRLLQEERERTRAREEQYAKELVEQRVAAEKAEFLKQKALHGRRSRGGRGGFMGEARAPSGPFSAGSVIEPTRVKTFPRLWVPSKRGRTAAAKPHGSSGIKREIGTDSEHILGDGGSSTTVLHGGYISSDPDEANEGPRKDVDYINLVSDDEGGDPIISNSFAPVRIHRVEHRDRAPPVNPDLSTMRPKKQDRRDEGTSIGGAMSAVKKGKQRARDNVPVRKERVWKGVYEDDEVSISSEEESSEPGQPSVSQPQLIAKNENINVEGANKTRRRKTFNQEPQEFQTEEDRKEWERRQTDLATLVAELSHVELKSPGDGDTHMTGGSDTAAIPDAKEDRVYLFQFPPVVPDLVPASMLSKMQEPESPTEARNAASGPENISATGTADQNTGEQKEEEAVTVKEEEEANTSVFPPRPTHLPHLASGRLGKLRVYKSGKAKLDWGGTSLQLNMGITPHFLQDSILVRTNPEVNPQDGIPAPSSNGFQGEAFAFGQVRGKFVVTPDWDEVMGGF